jgi:protein-disulfide isomerase
MKNKITCAVCGDVAELVSSINDVYIGKINKKVFVDFISYQCDACEESFTTTEVDELNLSKIEIGIRNFKRMLKINKIIKQKTL